MDDEKKYEEALKRVGEKDLMEDFEKEGEYHVFSKSYEKQKEALLIKARQKESIGAKRKKWSKAIKVMLAGAAAMIVVPVTVFAAYKHYTIQVQERNYAREVRIEEVISEVKPVEMKVSYLPAGVVESEIDEWKYKAENGEWRFTLHLIKVDTKAEFLIDNIENKQDIELNNGAHVLLGTRPEEEDFYNGAVFYDQQGYILEIWATGMPKEELVKIMEGISLEETTGAGTRASSLAAITDANGGKEAEVPADSEMADINERSIYKEKEKFIHTACYDIYSKDWKEGKLEMSVEDVKVLDSVSDISEDTKAMGEDLEVLADAAGKLLPHEREFGVWGDGIDAPGWVTNEIQTVDRKLLSVTVRMKNETGKAIEDIDIFPRLLLLTETDGAYRWLENSYRDFNNSKEAYSMDIYGDGNDGKGFYFVDFDKDEEKQITITFLVDEDELGNAFLAYEGSGDGSYIDIRK